MPRKEELKCCATKTATSELVTTTSTLHVSDRPCGGGRPAYTIVYRSKAGSRTNLRLRICEDTLGPLAGIPDCRQRRAVPPPASGLEGDLDSVKVKIFEYFGLGRLFEILNLNRFESENTRHQRSRTNICGCEFVRTLVLAAASRKVPRRQPSGTQRVL